jgi:transposase
MAFYLGFDVAKLKHDYSLINEQGHEICSGKIKNTEAAVASLLESLQAKNSNTEIICVVEATGGYQDTITSICVENSFKCLVYNPIITKQHIKASVRGKKTDKTDAKIIARVGWSGQGREYVKELNRNLKHLVRSSQKLSMYSSSFRLYTNHLTTQTNVTLTDEFKQLLLGVDTRIQQARKQICADIEQSANGDMYNNLKSIPGIGPYIAASIIGEIQDIKRFNSTKALIAYTGLDPKIKQSGKSLNHTGKLTKRGSSYLRRSIFIAAGVARMHDPMFGAIYDKKRNEGKPYTVATCAVARKMLAVIRAVMLSNKPYQCHYTENT